MRKITKLAISAMIIIVIMTGSLVACSYKTKDIIDFKLEYLLADSKSVTFKDYILAIDDGNEYIKEGTQETYVIKNGERADVYTSPDGIDWTHENLSVENSPTIGFSDSSMDKGTLEDVKESLLEAYRDFSKKFTKAEDGFWYYNADTAKAEGVKIEGTVCTTKTACGERREQIGYDIVLPKEAELAN